MGDVSKIHIEGEKRYKVASNAARKTWVRIGGKERS
jgi:hypothetical protein